MMNRRVPYSDGIATPYTSHMQHIAVHDTQENPAMDIFPGQNNNLRAGPAISSYILSQDDRDVPRMPAQNQLLTQIYPDARPGSNSISRYHRSASDSTADLANIVSREAGNQSHEQDMEIGYEDKPQLVTFEGLERRFKDEIFNLIKEQADAEDAENTRHKEKLIELNDKYQEKLSTLRAQQASRRKEFLGKELEERQRQYQQTETGNPWITNVPNDPHSYAGTYHSAHAGRPERASFPRWSQGAEERVPYPRGRDYDQTGARY
ncbi:uncharacterized protein [Primulina huaijiensis]|uniref:uncharacterized protein n=1 Tax=Primulina huaijiensis TaxID=1492673 RepID=UPI003CC7074A